MMTHAYSNLYIMDAQETLGDMFDFAVNTCKIPIGTAASYFVDSGVAEQFGLGNPRYVAGRTGCELLRDCIWALGLDPLPQKDALYMDGAPEYWAGWALAYYQWLKNIPFEEILDAVPMEKIVRSYYPLHEADIRKFVEIMDEWIEEAKTTSREHTQRPAHKALMAR